MNLIVRPLTSAELPDWRRMRFALWPHMSEQDFESESADILAGRAHDFVLIAVDSATGAACGFAEVSIRNVAEGCDTRDVGFLEGLWTEPAYRRGGVARALVEAAEAWARAQGCREFASDTELENEVSIAVHARLGFEEAGRIVAFKKRLDVSG